MRWFLPIFLLLGGPVAAQEVSRAPEPVQLADDAARPPVPAGWQTITGPFLKVHGHPDDLQTLLRLSEAGEARLPELAKELGVPLGGGIDVFVADTQQRFRELQPGRAPTWADGVAYPSLSMVLLRSPGIRGGMAEPLEQVLDHELVHILLGRAFLPNHPPSWLQEGFAQVWAGEVGPETTKTLATGLATNNVLSLQALSRGFPSDPVRARIAYAQSADFIGWFHETYGDEAIQTLIHELAAGTAIEGAIHASTGDFLEAVEKKWRRRLDGSGLSWSALGNMDVMMGLGGVLLVIGGIARRRQFHQRLEEMEAEEAALDALIASYYGGRRVH